MIWVNRNKEQLDAVAEEADRRGEDAPRGGQAARRRLSRRAGRRAPPDVVVVTSRVWQTTCTLVRSGEEAFCIDSPVLPGRARDPARDRRAGALPRRRAAGHARRLGPPARPLRVPGRAARASAETDRGAAARRARRARSASCATSTTSSTSSARRRCRCRTPQALPVPGRCEIGDAGARAAPGATATPPTAWRSGSRGRACWSCGDYLSPVEIPMAVRGGSRERLPRDARRGSSRSSSRPSTSCPGHGGPIDGARAAAILREDRAYLRGAAGREAAAGAAHGRAEEDPRRERGAGGC